MAVKKKHVAKKMVKKAKVVAKKPAKKKAVAKKAPTKKVVSKKAVAKKVVAKKAAKKKVVAKKAAKKKVVAKKAAAKKPAIKKASKKKAVVKKASITKPIKAKAVKKTTEGKGSRLQTRYTDKDLVEFKKLITDKLEASRKELKYLNEQINRTAELGSDDSDNKRSGLEDGTGTSEKEYLNQMASRQITYIEHLEKALVRIANRTYGVCRVTGKLISKDRLRAVPHATLSIEAKKAQSAEV